MWGWRGRIGLIVPGSVVFGPEFYPILPEGVAINLYTLSLERLAPEEIERTSSLYLPAAKHLATQECDVIVPTGLPMMAHMGYDGTREMTRKITETTGIPAISDLEAVFNALSLLSAKKIVYVSPLLKTTDEKIKRVFETAGFEVVNMKSLGLERRVEFGKQPPYASYRLARQAFFETPEADAIWILCPEWPTVSNIQRLENEVEKPVVSHTAAIVWAALRMMHIKEPIRGYGRLLELL